MSERRRKLFGRRKGPKLSAHQERLLVTFLPELALDLETGRDPKSYFCRPVEDVWLEVGFGAGEHLLWQAEHHPDVGLIGAEPYVSGVAKLLSKLDAIANVSRSLLPAGREGREEAESSTPQLFPPLPSTQTGRGERFRNIRIYSNDARDILDALPQASLARVFVLFPDPWPKTRHHKRRFVQTDTLDALARVMKRGAEFRFASDDAGYVNWTLERFIAHAAFHWTAERAQDWRMRPGDWPQTRYEAKQLHGAPVFLRFVRV